MKNLNIVTACVFLVGAISTFQAKAASPAHGPAYGQNLEGFNYTYSVKEFEFTSQGQRLTMAYMDVLPDKPNNRTIVLLHGKLFCADTWRATIKSLSDSGFRVIAPDQIGFCKSSKPERYQYSFQQLSSNTRALLDNLKINDSIVMGHSMGGMLAIRYGLMYPQATTQLLLINPLGLEDWKAHGVPYVNIDTHYKEELTTNKADLKEYQRIVHYNGEWRPEFDRWVDMLTGMYKGDGLPLVARNAALTSDMIFNQPVFYEFEQLKVPTVLFVGLKDKTAITNGAPPQVLSQLANYSALGKAATARIPQAKLIEFEDLAHSPHLQQPERFNKTLLSIINTEQTKK
ncbi:alpha/beta fold hydrolase [Pseudomonas fluorescens]|uniref:2-succinyl-6-hydroxy-2, 4-cyclohexadiene-1-carboxylate synthase n=1 Tax=Pseudomonas fluorescens TaxID=294 RepID=A0A5E7CX40_PSEFL|nr:alpha/beta hydrolase [Pseudomonas fluorescens]VVN99881.1 2-succinyl-6-hydroxy-2, 4-cyclohexadiene-1-carboxylate synthase [Pseudomonas fluorescens]